MGEVLMTVSAAAQRLSLSKSTLDKMRVRGGGPCFVKLGHAVRYQECDLIEWIVASRQASTSVGANDNSKE